MVELPERIGHWFVNPREETAVVEVVQCSPPETLYHNNDEETYCYCKGKDDNSEMI